MGYQTLLVERTGPLATITLNRPDARNAIDLTMRQELVAALDEVEADAAARVLILTGSGGHFCAGGDDAHGRHRGRLDAPRRERRVAEILDEHRIGAALDQGVGVRERGGHDAGHRPVPSRTPGQGREVDHSDDRARETHQR